MSTHQRLPGGQPVVGKSVFRDARVFKNSDSETSTSLLKELRTSVSGALEGLRSISGEIAALSGRVMNLGNTVMGRSAPHRAIYLGDHEVLTEIHSGPRIYVDSRDVGIASHLMWHGRWETWVEDQLMAQIRPGMHVLDIGANFGYYTLRMGQHVGPKGSVHAFEANPAIARKLVKSVAVNGYAPWTTVHPIALADKHGEHLFAFDPYFSGGGRFAAVSDGAREEITVPTAPLDALLPETHEVDVVKMDVEGAEGLVLRGGNRVFSGRRLRAVVTEFTPGALKHYMDPREFLDFFLARGFSMSLIEIERTRATTIDALLAPGNDDLGYLLFERQV